LLTLATMTPVVRKCAAISVFSRDIRKYATPKIETIIDGVMRRDINEIIDTALTDDQPGDATRPPGLLYGLAPLAAGADLASDLLALASALLGRRATSSCTRSDQRAR
jgi:hypothetical protein